MKKIQKSSATVLGLLMMGSAAAFVGCGPRGEAVDKNKTQLYVANYNGGVGEKWLDEAAARFTEANENTEFTPGKKGVQIIIDHDKSYNGTLLVNSIKADDNEVYFTQGVDYPTYVATGAVKDISNLVENVLDKDGKTIKSKLYPQMDDALNIDGKYYGIPHYELYAGLNYDAGIFEKRNLYFADAIDDADATYVGTRKFVTNKTTKKSCGPDGKYGTSDDGLPSSFHEFYKLMDKMIQNNVTPFVFTGKSPHYTNLLIQSLCANLLGPDAVQANFVFDSNGKEVEVVTDFNDTTPIIEKKVITEENAYLIKSTAGLYYALEFAEKVFGTSSYYYTPCTSSTYTHLMAMESFMLSGLDGENHIAMLIDGNYWYNEANDDGLFERLENNYAETYTSKDVKFMPLPQKYSGTVVENEGRATTLVDTYQSYALVNAKTDDDKMDLVESFLSFLYAEEELKNFTVATNGVLKGVSYDFSSCKSQVNSYAQSFLEMRENAVANGTYVIGTSSHDIFRANTTKFEWGSTSTYWASGEKNNFYGSRMTAKEYFLGMGISQSDWSNKYNK